MRSQDWVQGPVLLVLSENTFEIQVTLVGRNNDFPYNARERIQIEDSTPALQTLTGEDAKKQLEDWLLGKTVRCYVHARELEGTLLGEVEIVD